MGRSNDDASDDHLANPPYKPRDEESSESELDDDDMETQRQNYLVEVHQHEVQPEQ